MGAFGCDFASCANACVTAAATIVLVAGDLCSFLGDGTVVVPTTIVGLFDVFCGNWVGTGPLATTGGAPGGLA